MKVSIIEIGLPTSNIPQVQSILEKSQAAGGQLIGRQIRDTQILLVLHLASDQILQHHLNLFSDALHRKQISSCQGITCHLFKIVFKLDDYQGILKTFPLAADESWFEAVEEARTAYLCLASPHLSQQQISWLAMETSVIQWTNES
ncbi:MAG TPA: hypothetical protein VFN35_23135 [Ktedonobacteraceae bacterium]|nr:hypothetical protein [Ktedonobacteraceae bacterium]